MKFFWKTFFSTMFISIACFALGGYLLIDSNFETLIDNEIQTAHDYSDIVFYTLADEFQKEPVFIEDDRGDKKTEAVRKRIAQVAESIDINNRNQKITFCIFDTEEKIVFSSLLETFSKTAIASLKDNQSSWSLKKMESHTYVQMIRPVVFRDSTFYTEMLRDVTYIFDNQKAQYTLLIKIMAGVLAFGGVTTYVVSKLLMRRMVALTKVTEEISKGNYLIRAKLNGADEFAALSKDFNSMADCLEIKMQELKVNAEKKEMFIGAFSHELKTPLTSIIGYSDMLRRKKMAEKEVHACAEYIFSEGKRLEMLSMRLLDLLVHKNNDMHFIPMDIKGIMEECFVILDPQLKQSKIRILDNMEHAVVLIEPDLIKTVFINLLDNARKSMNDGGTITVEGVRMLHWYKITIQDTGHGMEKEESDKIKEAFYMVDKSRSRKQGGAGLGLAICDEIIRLHDFTIDFASTVNIGTTVTITMRGDKR